MSELLVVTLDAPPATASVGEAIALRVRLSCPPDRPGRVRLAAIAYRGETPDVFVDADLLPVGLELGAGEEVRVVLMVRFATPRSFDINALFVGVFEEGRSQEVPFPHHAIAIGPNFGGEVELTVEPLCHYDHGVKVRVAFKHVGATTFDGFTLAFGPPATIRAGQTVIRRPALKPGDEGAVDLVVTADALTAELNAAGVAATRTLPVLPLTPRAAGQQFRFLEPRRLTNDRVWLTEETANGKREVMPEHAAYPIRSGGKYTLTLEPQDATVTAIRPRDLPRTLHVLGQSYDADRRRWRFVLDVSANDVLTDPGTLYYEADRADGTAMGEIPLLVRPPYWKHWKVAAALGFGLTVQGIASLAKALADADGSLADAWGAVDWTKDYPKLFLLVIPVAWLCLTVLDRARTALRR